MRLGILGGSFDPPHNGHLLVAADAFERLGLDRLALVPAATQPLKPHGAGATPAHRLAMVRLAIGDDGRFEADPIEIDRSGLSFTVDTLEAYARQYQGAERYLLVGADAAASFAKWRQPDRIVQLARLVVLARAGEVNPIQVESLVLKTRRIDISSTEIRERVRTGRSVRGFVPEPVAAYIAAHQLYR